MDIRCSQPQIIKDDIPKIWVNDWPEKCFRWEIFIRPDKSKEIYTEIYVALNIPFENEVLEFKTSTHFQFENKCSIEVSYKYTYNNIVVAIKDFISELKKRQQFSPYYKEPAIPTYEETTLAIHQAFGVSNLS